MSCQGDFAPSHGPRADERGEWQPRLLPAELEALLLPKDLLAFARLADERLGEIARLLDAGREPVERAERLVCRIYGLPAELEDEVVTHAIERAARRAPGDDG